MNSPHDELERPVDTIQYQDGYPAVASFVSQDPDGETYVFRQFSRLTARKLMHLESELIDLERKQEEIDRVALSSTDPDLRSSIRSWSTLTKNANVRQEEKDMLELSNQIDTKLGKYHEALLLKSSLLRLDRPSKAAVQACRSMLLGPHGNDAKLGGNAQKMFAEDYEDDLITLAPVAGKDILSEYLKRHWMFPAESKKLYPGVLYFDARSVALLANICAISIAALLLIGPIIILYFVTYPDARLGLVVAFIILFAIGLSVSTGATRDAIFAATAAYTAVLVVFVSGDLGNARLEGKGA